MRNRILCIIRKELTQTFRDPRARGMLIMPPLIQLLIFGFAVNLDVDMLARRLRGWIRTERRRAARCGPGL